MRHLAVVLMAMTLVVSGCAMLNRSEMTVALPEVESRALIGKEVYVGTIVDRRVFEDRPRNASTPSLDPKQENTPEIRVRAIGRLRSGYGNAIGDVVLKEGTVETLTADAIRQTLTGLGYTVIMDKDQITENTIVIEGTVDKFWSWVVMMTGFRAGIKTSLDVRSPDRNRIVETEIITVTCPGYIISPVNTVRCVEQALQEYVDELKKDFE